MYSGTDLLWAKFLELLWSGVEKQFGKYTVRLHRASISLSKEKDDDDLKTKLIKRRAGITGHVLSIVVSILMGGVLLTLGLTVDTINEALKDSWKGSVTALASFSPALYYVVKFASKVLPELYQSRGEKILNQVQGFETFDRPDFSQKTGFKGEVAREVEYLFDFIRTNYFIDHDIKRRIPVRLGPFLDDLDRCPKNVIMEVLEVTILLLADAPVSCYLAIDSRLVVASIEDHFGDRFSKAGLDGYQYLEKIVQLPFCIPDLDGDRKKNFLMKMLEGNALEPLSMYQRLKFLAKEGVEEIQSVFTLKLSDPRNDTEAFRALIPSLEQMIEKNIFAVPDSITNSSTFNSGPRESLDAIKNLLSNPFDDSNTELERLRDQFLHWLSIGIEALLRDRRNKNSTSQAAKSSTSPVTGSSAPTSNAVAESQDNTISDLNIVGRNQTTPEVGDVEQGDVGTATAGDAPASSSSDNALTADSNIGLRDADDVYGAIFTPLANAEELDWFGQYAGYLIGRPRKMKRIVNCYMVARYISNILRRGVSSGFDSLFNKKLLKFTILLEQWPYRMAWMLLIVENYQQELEIRNLKGQGSSCSSIGESISSLVGTLLTREEDISSDQQYQELPLIKIYEHIVQVLVHSSHDAAIQLQRDGDPQVFEQMLLDDGEHKLRLKDISLPDQGSGKHSLRPYGFNLQRHTIEKVSVELENCTLHSVGLQNDAGNDGTLNSLEWHAAFKKKSEAFDNSVKNKA